MLAMPTPSTPPRATGGDAPAGLHSVTPPTDSISHALHGDNGLSDAQNAPHACAQQNTSMAEDGARAPKVGGMERFLLSGKYSMRELHSINEKTGDHEFIMYPKNQNHMGCLDDALPYRKAVKSDLCVPMDDYELKNCVYYKNEQCVFVSSCENGKTATIEMNEQTTTVPMNMLEVIFPDKNNTNATPEDTADPSGTNGTATPPVTTDTPNALGTNATPGTIVTATPVNAGTPEEETNGDDARPGTIGTPASVTIGTTAAPGTIGTTAPGTTVTRPATGDDMKNLIWIMHDRFGYVGCTEYKAAEHWTLTAQQAKNNFQKWILNTARLYPMSLLSIDTGIFQKLQAMKNAQTKVFDWTGFVSGGAGIPLPAPYVSNVFRRDLIRECKSNPGVPIACARVGSAKSASPMEVEDRAPPSATVDRVPPVVQYLQGDKDHCVGLSTASAVHHAGDEAAGKIIATLAPAAIKEHNAVEYVKTQCNRKLRPAWTVCKIKGGAQNLDWQSLADPSVVTVVQLRDSAGNIEHCVSIVSGWIFDTNKKHAIKLSKEGLDACCLGGATFAGFQAGFQLIHTKKRGREEM